jgi:hypothetical protein
MIIDERIMPERADFAGGGMGAAVDSLVTSAR